ncbi:2OG-Fe(II) oxygenase [Undibacterium sp. CY18W]|uniref:2OG-Fe(II) oxygenase n=1 Tax=Undibacterium hunanense TaxID=2762292 RepID=A0ABR6ZLZ1_9BURK|nr:2OG-Fe(II) oxygenase [Undibacterium hunanense]MBC3916425.1 2OG-Fe(II) oxygenase [Undibacterium hunanense]
MLIHDFLSAEECQHYISLAENAGFQSAETDYPPSYRNNDRLVMDNPLLAARLFQRLNLRLDQRLNTRLQEHEQAAAIRTIEGWQLHGINERLRFCRYRPHQQFNIHQDGVHFRHAGYQSKLTFMIYLSDEADFDGGDTVFFDAGPESASAEAGILGRITPKAGSLILFDHSLWHAGEVVTRGVKHILRSDLMYRQQPALYTEAKTAFTPAHQGYVWAMAKLPQGRIASAGRDTSIRIWQDDGSPANVLHGHSQSVLGLAVSHQQRLASVSRDRSLRLWNLETGLCEKTVRAHDAAVLGICSLPASGLATCSADHSIKLWTDDAEYMASLHGHTGWVWAISPLSDNLLASASEDGTVRLWNIRQRQCVAVLPGDIALRCLTASEDGDSLVTGDINGTLTVWSGLIELSNRPTITRQLQAHHAAVRSIRFLSADLLVSSGEDKCVKLWSKLGDMPVSSSSHANFVTDILVHDHGNYLSCSYDGSIRMHAAPGI